MKQGDHGMTVVGRRLAQLRVRAGYRYISELADASGVDRSIISYLELGRRDDTSKENWHKLAAALGVTVDALTNPQEEAAPLPAYGRPAVPADGLSPADAQQLLDMVNEYIRTHRR